MKLPLDEVVSIRPEDVHSYLIGKGWRIDPRVSRDGVRIFSAPKKGQLILPLDRAFGDYALRMADLVTELADRENVSPFILLKTLTEAGTDCVRIRVDSAITTAGNVPLEMGVRLVVGAHAMLQAVANSVHSPRPFFHGKSHSDVAEFMSKCRLGQTERGSYVATVQVPVARVVNLTRQKSLFEAETLAKEVGVPSDDSEPFARRVTSRLMTALQTIQTGIERDDVDLITESVNRGVSADLCDALSHVEPPGDNSSLDISVAWSPGRPLKSPTLSKPVVFTSAQFGTIAEIGKVFRNTKTSDATAVVGHIVGLHAEQSSLFEGVKGKVDILASVGDRRLHVQAALDHAQYSAACDAHRDGNPVLARGVLKSRDDRNKAVLLQVSEFTQLDKTTANISKPHSPRRART